MGGIGPRIGREMLLRLENVAKTNWVGPYEKRTLIDVSLSVAHAEFVAIWGGQRSGKSTLLRIAAGLQLPDAGVVRFDGQDLAGLSRVQRGHLRLRHIGLICGDGPQSSEFTVAEFVALPLLGWHSKRRARQHTREILSAFGIAECRDARWHQLSDSERALVSAAHALVRRPRLVLADDPTFGLDTLQQVEVVDLLRRGAAAEGIAVVMLTSTMFTLNGTYDSYTLSDGELQPIGDSARSGTVVQFPSGERSA